MKHNLLKVLKPFFLTLTLTAIVLFVCMFEGKGANNKYFCLSYSSVFQVNPGGIDSVIKGVKLSQPYAKSFRIQVCALRHKVSNIQLLEQACGQNNLIVEEIDEYYKYLTPAFTQYELAINAVNEINAIHGFEDSFIVSFIEGNRSRPSLGSFKTKNVITPLKQSSLATAKDKQKPIVHTTDEIVEQRTDQPKTQAAVELAKPLNVRKSIMSIFSNEGKIFSSNLVVYLLLLFTLAFLFLALYLIVNHFRKKHNIKVPDLSKLFDSSNPSEVKYAIKMVSQCSRLEASEYFDELLKHADKGVRMSVIEAIGDMHLTRFSTRLISIFNNEHEKLKLIILQTMEKLEDPDLLNFLSDIVLFNLSMNIRLLAAKALTSIGPLGIARMQTLLLNKDSEISYIYNQISV
jgi:hypothetical protein